MHRWLDRIAAAKSRTGSSVCCGLDLDYERLPEEYKRRSDPAEALILFLEEILDLTRDHVCCYKLQKAFFDRKGGLSLHAAVTVIRKVLPTVPLILDAKLGDIDNTMRSYLSTFFDECDLDAVVLNPYMGPTVWSSLESHKDRAAFVLVRTSNPDSEIIQRAPLADGRELWHLVVDELVRATRTGKVLIPTLSALDPVQLRNACQLLPRTITVFVAGIGAQGGDASILRNIVGDRDIIVNSSRAIVFPYAPADRNWRNMVIQAVERLKKDVN